MYGNMRSETFPPPPAATGGLLLRGGEGKGGEGEATALKNLALNKRTRGADLP